MKGLKVYSLGRVYGEEIHCMSSKHGRIFIRLSFKAGGKVLVTIRWNELSDIEQIILENEGTQGVLFFGREIYVRATIGMIKCHFEVLAHPALKVETFRVL